MWNVLCDVLLSSNSPLGIMHRRGTYTKLQPLTEGVSPAAIFPLPLMTGRSELTSGIKLDVIDFANLLLCVQNLPATANPKLE